MFVDLHDSCEATINEDCPNHRLKDVTKNFRGFKMLNFALIHFEIVLHKGEVQVVFYVMVGMRVSLRVIVDDVLVES